jgi:hypothetical protein
VILFPWYATLCVAQGLLVAAPAVGRETTRRNALLGLAGPAAAMVIGVGLVGLAGGSGADVLAWLGTVATPLLAGVLGWTARWRMPYLTAVAAAALYVIAWQAGGHVAQAAGALLIGGACLAIASIVGPITPARYLAVGLVVLVALDVYLVWGTQQVEQTTTALQQATLPHVGVAHHETKPLPSLQQVELGDSNMGWLDFAAPALLGAVVGRRTRLRLRAALAVTVAALLWGLLLQVTSPIPATVPVLAGLALTWPVWWRAGISADGVRAAPG